MGTCSPQIGAIFVVFKELPKANNRPRGKNSPNLVTLPLGPILATITAYFFNYDETTYGPG
jgi:hypothetical protein